MADLARKEIVHRGYRIAYLTWGEGPPLLLVAGQLMAADDWVGVGYADAFSDYRVVAVDPLGYGRSDKPHNSDAYLLEDRAGDFAAVLDAESVAVASVWGYSFGATLVEPFARLRPDRTNGVVLGGNVPGLNAQDRRNVGEPGIAAYESGDWATVWRDALPFVRTEVRPEWERRNDLRAVAASVRGSWEPHSAEDGPLPTPLLCYVGTGDWYWEISQAMVAGPGTSFIAVTEHDHSQAFVDVRHIASIVRPFLTSCNA